MHDRYPVCVIASTLFISQYLRYLESLLRDARQFLVSNKRVKTTRLYITLRFSCANSDEIDDGDKEGKRAT